jgi:hypothetical protein
VVEPRVQHEQAYTSTYRAYKGWRSHALWTNPSSFCPQGSGGACRVRDCGTGVLAGFIGGGLKLSCCALCIYRGSHEWIEPLQNKQTPYWLPSSHRDMQLDRVAGKLAGVSSVLAPLCMWKATICNHARPLSRPWVVPSADARHLCDCSTSRALAELFRVLRPLRISQCDFDSALVSLDGAHSSLHEFRAHSISMRAPVHSQHSHEKTEKSWNVHFADASFKCSTTWRPSKDHDLCEAGGRLLGLRW